MKDNELTEFILQIAYPLMRPALILCGIGCAFWLIIYLIKVGIYKQSAYYRATGNSYRTVMGDTGRYGEYLTGKELAGLGGSVFYNVYIPKREGTTEADIVMVHPSGVYVIESKNYSGAFTAAWSSRTGRRFCRGERVGARKRSAFSTR